MRLLIVGAGPRGIEHGEAIRGLEGWAVVGVVDTRLEARERAATALDVATFAGLQEGLERTSPDVVTIAVPVHRRTGLIETVAGQQGIRALVIEKPLALGLADARCIAADTEKAGILAVVCHQLRFSPEFVALSRAIEEGRLGTVRFLRGECYGNLLEQGPHLIDAMSWLAGGRRFEWVMSQACDDAKALAPFAAVDPDRHPSAAHPAPLFMTHTFGMEGGLEAVLRTGIIAAPSDPDLGPWLRKRVMVVGSRGWGEARVAGTLRLVGDGGESEQRFTLEDFKGATRSLYSALKQSLEDGRPHPTRIAQAIPISEAMIAAGQSALVGGLVALPIADDAVMPDFPAIKREPAPATRADISGRSEFELSILLPLPDHRGNAERCVRSWTEDQCAAPERFELIVVSDGKDAETDDKVRAALRSQDRLLIASAGDELEMYDIAARTAQGDLLFLSEPHCVAERETVNEILKYITTSGEDGAVARTVTLASNAIARAEARMYDDGFVGWSRPGNWCKVILRGFAIKRSAYLAVGGFEYRYGRFSEWLLAATLHKKGYSFGYMPGAALAHWYLPSLSDLRPFIRNFTEGECSYRSEYSSGDVLPYFGNPPEWSLMRSRAPELAQLLPSVVMSLAKGARQRREARLLATLASRLPQFWLEARGSVAWPKLRARIKVLLASMRCAVWQASEGDRLYRAYVDHYMRYTTFCRIAFISREPRTGAKLADGREQFTYTLTDLPNDDIFGFHPVESFRGVAFRWASGLAAMRVYLPKRDYRLLIETGGLGPSTRSQVAVFINRKRVAGLTPVVTAKGKRKGLEGRIRDSAFDPDRPTWLVLVCASRRRSHDARDLGLPVARVTFEPL